MFDTVQPASIGNLLQAVWACVSRATSLACRACCSSLIELLQTRRVLENCTLAIAAFPLIVDVRSSGQRLTVKSGSFGSLFCRSWRSPNEMRLTVTPRGCLICSETSIAFRNFFGRRYISQSNFEITQVAECFHELLFEFRVGVMLTLINLDRLVVLVERVV